ncbi:hypothetical protein GCM10009706_14250 [Curtobacterium citreum]|uniref:Head-to-tail stopper n=1 Tax=Curtobacterium citreum TaxID=2036 RepID=A0ABT2HDT3_9MICO|nr:hypothetical protein [Curtobacterium citreum]MCS6521348.1 hypothetical protein [Curtobacterium citreum]TQJ28207.1 hypothetical protein FB462_2087 [Curtobacterium citreum]GGL76961.1 hypothetical protein GCM10009706_14250 [Curtobacterium citreum]
MEFAAGATVVRLRATPVLDPYSQRPVGADWTAPNTLTIAGAFVGSSSSSPVDGELRREVVTTKSLYCDPSADVRVGDRIVSGAHTYTVTAVPEADVNPWTGWQPVQEIPLEEVVG